MSLEGRFHALLEELRAGTHTRIGELEQQVKRLEARLEQADGGSDTTAAKTRGTRGKAPQTTAEPDPSPAATVAPTPEAAPGKTA